MVSQEKKCHISLHMGKKAKKVLGIRGMDKDSQYSRDYEKFILKLRHKINRLRLERGLTIEKLAEQELSVRQIKRILGGEVGNFTIAYLYKIAKALKVKPHELLEL